MTNIEILKSCFHSDAKIWRDFTSIDGDLNTLYYPSAGEDLRPFVFSIKENLNFMGLKNDDNYFEPDLFIFSDYFPHCVYGYSRFFDTNWLHYSRYTQIFMVDYCELFPTNNYEYRFNKSHVHFEKSVATGKAIFFKAKINSHRINEPIFKYGIYFFYENVNLIEQLFLKNKMTFSHVVWKRDGSGLGGGSVKHDFIYHVAYLCKTRFFFLWDLYQNQENVTMTNESYNIEYTPMELRSYLNNDFQISLIKKNKMLWDGYDKMNLYFKM